MADSDSAIRYIRPDAPAPPPTGALRGVRSEAIVPATLDLAERAALAVNGMTGPTDPELDYRVYWQVSFRHNPPVMYHEFADIGIQAKFMETLPRLRMMSGSDQGTDAEETWKQVLLRMIGPDGLLATPMEPHAWQRPTRQRVVVTGFSGYYEGNEHLIETQVNGLMLGAVATFAELDDRDFWGPIGRDLVEGIRRLTVSDGQTAYYPVTYFLPGETADPSTPPPLGTEAAFSMWTAARLLPFYRVTGYEPALELAGQMCRYMLRRSQYFGADFEWLCDNPDPDHPRHKVNHAHHHAMTIRCCLDYGLATGDQEPIEFAHRAYDRAKGYMECLTGFLPRDLNPDEPDDSEICGVADMIRTAVLLAEAGLGDGYWDDVDRWSRNNLAEGQFLRHDWVNRLHLGEPPTMPFDGAATERVCERNVGAFGGWQAPNEFVDFKQVSSAEDVEDERGSAHGIMHCCTANGARALYDIWRSIVRADGDRVRVNLLLNRAAPEVDVDSHLPYTGQVDFHVKRDCELDARLPGWVSLPDVRGAVDGSPRDIGLDGRAATLGAVKTGQTATLNFPIAERTDRVTARNRWYFLQRKGHDVVLIDPPGGRCPLYQRDHYRDDATLWKKVTRYVDERIADR